MLNRSHSSASYGVRASSRRRRRFRKKQSYKRLLKQSQELGLPFCDDEFKAEDRSVVESSSFRSRVIGGAKVAWKRPTELAEVPHFLFREKLGPLSQIDFICTWKEEALNESFVAAALAVAYSGSKQLFYQLVPKNQINFMHGIFKFNFWRFGRWFKVVIDDRLPVISGDDELIFIESYDGGQYWLPLLEKAYAKMCGSYEQMAKSSNIVDLLTDMTGGMVECVPLAPASQDVEDITTTREQFRLLHEELDQRSLIVAQTHDSPMLDRNPLGLKPRRYYLVQSAKKPAAGTFRKMTSSRDSSSSAMIRILNTLYDGKRRPRNDNRANAAGDRLSRSAFERLDDTWITIEDFQRYFAQLFICRIPQSSNSYKSEMRRASSSSQFCFDVADDQDDIIIDLMQIQNDTCDSSFSSYGASSSGLSTSSSAKIAFHIHRVEENRLYKLHNINGNIPQVVCDGSSPPSLRASRSAVLRVKLSPGRYILMPQTSSSSSAKANGSTNPSRNASSYDVLLRILSTKSTHLRILTQDMPKKNLVFFLAPKYPKFVTKIIVKGARDLERQDRFASANPYVVIRCGRSVIKSQPVESSLSPTWSDLSAIFYHGSHANIRVEVWHHGLLIDSFMGQIDIAPRLVTSESLTAASLAEADIEEAQLEGRKKGHKRPGFIQYQVFTSEDLRSF